MRKKLLIVCLSFVMLFGFCTNVNAEDLLEVNIYEEDYILSEQKTPEMLFINQFTGKTILDEDVNKSGMYYSIGELQILKSLKGVHILISNDTVTIKGNVDNAVIIAPNVVIEGKINGDAIIYSPSLFIKENAEIAGDIMVSSNQMEMDGKINGSLIASITESLKITGTITKNLRVQASSIDANDANILGKIYVKTYEEMPSLLEKYPEAKIDILQVKTNNIESVIIQGVLTVAIFVVLGLLVTRKDNNLVTKVLNKVKDNTASLVLPGVAILLPAVLVVSLLLLLCVFGLWIIAVPVLVIYLAIILTACMLSVLIVGTVLFETVKYKVIKNYETNTTIKKIGLLALIYTVLYVLTVIPFIATYVSIILSVISAGILMSSLVKKKQK
ncbi:MAG: polymer-forming cytoskeletal protein [Clostridia bacterium]|nr:polymer-forming cytoskeletal protein [Clostridia bacterium]